MQRPAYFVLTQGIDTTPATVSRHEVVVMGNVQTGPGKEDHHADLDENAYHMTQVLRWSIRTPSMHSGRL